jgi:UDP-N-acetylmuramoylalanine--D-glutamate ligase
MTRGVHAVCFNLVVMGSMQRYHDFFAGKRITLMGLGLLGRGVGDAAFLAGLGARLTVTDRKSKEELAASVEQLAAYSNIAYVLGEHRLEDFRQADMVIKAAGVPLNSPYIEESKKAGVPVYMSTALFAKFAMESGGRLVGITGTRGKSTVTHLIHHALEQSGRRTHLGGNVRGLSTLAMLPDVRAADHVVLELDSWQLQGFGDLRLSPDVAVFTNLQPDHLNYYPDLDTYFDDKANIFRHQKAGAHLIAGSSVAERIRAARPPIAPVVPEPLPASWSLCIIGPHNRENAALAAEALRALGLEESVIQRGLESFEPVEGRLQFVRRVGEVEIYNDNNATTPAAVVAALRSFPPGDPLTLIAGGADKKIPIDDLVEEICARHVPVILLPGTGTDRLRARIPLWTDAQDMRDAMRLALEKHQRGVIVFSPGFASFGRYSNEYERNDDFLQAVASI